jgi:hypothetical protein
MCFNLVGWKSNSGRLYLRLICAQQRKKYLVNLGENYGWSGYATRGATKISRNIGERGSELMRFTQRGYCATDQRVGECNLSR